MIKINLLSKDNKILTNYEDQDVTLNDCSLMIRELELIKKHLLEKEFDNDVEIIK